MMAFAPGACPPAPFGNPADLSGPIMQDAACNPHTEAPPGASEPITSLANDVANGLLSPYISSLTANLGEIAKSSATFFTNAPATLSPQMLETVEFLRGRTAWIAGLVMAVAMMIGGAKLAIEGKGEDLAALAKSMLVWLLINGSAVGVISLLLVMGHRFSVWILDQATAGKSFAENLTELLVAPDKALSGLLLLLVMVIAALASLWVYATLTLRLLLLIPLLAALPITSASYSTEAGKAATLKVVGWAFAVTISQPAIAFIYATAFKLMSASLDTDDGMRTVVFGLVTLGLAGITLPALLRLVAPATAAIVGSSGGGGGGSAAAGAAMLAGGPTGAVAATGAKAASGVAASASGSSDSASGSADGASGGAKGAKGSAPAGGSEPASGGQEGGGKTTYRQGRTSTSPTGPDLN